MCNGQNVALGEIEWGANGEELVRYPVDGKYRGVPVADMPPNYEEAIFVFGDGGATEILSCGCGKVSGRVLGGGGIGYSVDPVSGNSGGAVVAGIVVNEKGKLIGLNKPATQGDFSGPSNCAVLVVGSVKWTSKTKEKERKKREFTTAKENAGKCPKNADALYEYGRMLLKGEGTEPNPVEAVGKLKESAKLGNAAAMFLLGMCYSKGDGIEKNEKEAVRWLEKAREKGNTSASSELFKMHNDGSELFKMHNDGKVYLRDVEELVARQELVRNDAKVDMNYELGRYYSHDGPERDLAKSAENMKDAAERGNVEAKWHYGCMLIHGKGVPKNEEKGVKYLEEAAAENCPEAKVHLSACLMNGTGCTKDEERANRLIQEAAEKNKYHQAMFMMFEKYRDGSGFAKDADQAFRYLEQSAKAGNPEALRVLGDTYCQKFQDPGVCIKKEEDLKLATNWWYKSAIKGDRRAQYRLGVVLWGGYGPIEMDHEAAKKWLLQAASKDNDMAQYSLGRLMLKECPKEAEHWLNKQAQNGNPKAKKWMSVLLSSRKDKIQARRYAEEAADEFENLINTNEDCEAMYELAGQYSAGLGVGQDRKKAFDLYWRAATNGFALAQFAVGYAYSNGEGVDRSDQKAVEWYKKSIKGGCVMGYTNLAYLYDHGEGVPTNPEDATYYYRKGAEYGDACAQVALGWRLMIGLGGERDTQEGFKWIQRAALQNYASAYFGASLCYYAGVGVEKNKAESGKWLGKVKMYGGGNETRKNIKVAIDALKQLAVEGDAWAMYLLGVSHDLGFVEYASGNGISKDEKTARIWYRRSAEKGCAEAKRQLEK